MPHRGQGEGDHCRGDQAAEQGDRSPAHPSYPANPDVGPQPHRHDHRGEDAPAEDRHRAEQILRKVGQFGRIGTRLQGQREGDARQRQHLHRDDQHERRAHPAKQPTGDREQQQAEEDAGPGHQADRLEHHIEAGHVVLAGGEGPHDRPQARARRHQSQQRRHPVTRALPPRHNYLRLLGCSAGCRYACCLSYLSGCRMPAACGR